MNQFSESNLEEKKTRKKAKIQISSNFRNKLGNITTVGTLSEQSTTVHASSALRQNSKNKKSGISNFIEIGKGLMSYTPSNASRIEVSTRFKSAAKTSKAMEY